MFSPFLLAFFLKSDFPLINLFPFFLSFFVYVEEFLFMRKYSAQSLFGIGNFFNFHPPKNVLKFIVVVCLYFVQNKNDFFVSSNNLCLSML